MGIGLDIFKSRSRFSSMSKSRFRSTSYSKSSSRFMFRYKDRSKYFSGLRVVPVTVFDLYLRLSLHPGSSLKFGLDLFLILV